MRYAGLGIGVYARCFEPADSDSHRCSTRSHCLPYVRLAGRPPSLRMLTFTFARTHTEFLVDIEDIAVSAALFSTRFCADDTQRPYVLPQTFVQVVADISVSAMFCVLLHRNRTMFKR